MTKTGIRSLLAFHSRGDDAENNRFGYFYLGAWYSSYVRRQKPVHPLHQPSERGSGVESLGASRGHRRRASRWTTSSAMSTRKVKAAATGRTRKARPRSRNRRSSYWSPANAPWESKMQVAGLGNISWCRINGTPASSNQRILNGSRVYCSRSLLAFGSRCVVYEDKRNWTNRSALKLAYKFVLGGYTSPLTAKSPRRMHPALAVYVSSRSFVVLICMALFQGSPGDGY